jgi:hypothetical protein
VGARVGTCTTVARCLGAIATTVGGTDGAGVDTGTG